MPVLGTAAGIPVVSETYSSTISSSIGALAVTVPVVSSSPYIDGDIVALTVDAGTVNQATFVGTKSGSSYIGCVWTEGALGVGHTIGASIKDYDSATHYALLAKVLRAHANNDGTLKPAAVDAAIAIGSIEPDKLQTGTGTSWAWQNYVPTWGGLTTGNGTLHYAKFNQTGKTTNVRIAFTFGSTSDITGNLVVSLPVNTSADYLSFSPIGQAHFHDSGAAVYTGNALWSSATQATLNPSNVSGTFATKFDANTTQPFDTAPGDQILVHLTYEAA